MRLIPGVLTDETSALSDSFQDGLVSPPIYTRPVEFNGWKVPDVLLSGNPKLIQDWQMQQALERTKSSVLTFWMTKTQNKTKYFNNLFAD